MGLFDRLRPQAGWKDPDPQVRRAAVRRLGDPAVLVDLRRADADEAVRQEAAAAILALAMEGPDEAAGVAAAGALDDARQLVQVARSALHESVSRAALSRLHDLKALGSIARHGHHASARLEALHRLVEFPAPAAGLREELQAIVLKSPHDDAALSALEHLTGSERFALPGDAAAPGGGPATDASFLGEIAEHGKSRGAARRARALLHERQEAGTGRPARPRTDRRAQLRLCEEAESLARSSECEPLAAQTASLQDAWTDRVPNVDDDLDERFQAAIQEARERLKRNLQEREERLLREERIRAFRETYVAPRLALIASIGAVPAEDAPRLLEDASWEWNRLDPLDDLRPSDPLEAEVVAEARALSARFDEARASCQEHHEKWLQDREDARLKEEDEARRREQDRKERDQAQEKRASLVRLEKLCERAERLLGAETLTLKKADPVLRDLRAALDDPPPLPSRRDHDRLLERLKAVRGGLAPRVQELRDAEKWKRWANTNVQEELCARAEALREIEEPEKAARLLPDLMERWKTAAVAEPDKSQALWQRFKAAADEVRARQAAQHAENASKKAALCEKAEALAASTDWVRTGEEIKALQAEWKTAGQAGRGQDRALWGRFRRACDAFFKRRDEDRARRKEEWARNLEAKEALCARAEALADSTDWRATADEMKRLQADWKTVGAVRPNRSEPIWQRFRAACDRFFERYKRRDQIDLELNLAAREAICRELEALAPGAAAPDGAAPPAPEALAAAIESIWDRWRKGPALPRERVAPLAGRFHQALDALIAARPDSVRGTLFDAEANRRKMEELCLRLERLLSGSGASADEALSPATRLATMWREALASNTIGGKVAEEARHRAAAEEVRKAQAAWQKIGYVPEETRRLLSERFERASRRLAPRGDRDTPAPRRAPAAGGRR